MRRRPLRGVILPALTLILVFAVVLLPSFFAPGDPLESSGAALLPPGGEHWLGTDRSGRDVYTRLVHGAVHSVGVGALAVLVAAFAGTVIGTLAGVTPRWVSEPIARATEVLMSFPEFLLALVLIAVFGKGEFAVGAAVAVAMLPGFFRLARERALLLGASGPVEAAMLLGVPAWRRVLRHVLPGVLATVSVVALISLGTGIVTVAGLSFLGLGIDPAVPEWGSMMRAGSSTLHNGWWVALFPGLAIAVTVIAASFLGTRVRVFLTRGIRE